VREEGNVPASRPPCRDVGRSGWRAGNGGRLGPKFGWIRDGYRKVSRTEADQSWRPSLCRSLGQPLQHTYSA